MKAIHNLENLLKLLETVVLYPKDTEKWKQFTTGYWAFEDELMLFCIPKILKNESNSQLAWVNPYSIQGCFVSQRYWKMKAIHNPATAFLYLDSVVLYPKDTEKWKQFTTVPFPSYHQQKLFCIPKILKNESNSQLSAVGTVQENGCFVSQRYWKMKAIHNIRFVWWFKQKVVLYPKDTEKWKQFTTNIYL